MTFFNFIKQLFLKEKIKTSIPISATKIKTLIPYSDGANIIYLTNPHVYNSDKSYKTIEKSEVEKFLKSDWTNFKFYKKETMDCDDFAFILLGKARERIPGGAFGWAASKTHAFNFFVDSNKKFWIIEPQTDKIFTSSDNKYQIKFCII